MKIHCYAAMGEKQPLEKFEYEAPELGDFDVQVSITHCGICYSDVHFIDNKGLGSGHSSILENQEKIPKNTYISVLINQFSYKNCPSKDGGC